MSRQPPRALSSQQLCGAPCSQPAAGPRQQLLGNTALKQQVTTTAAEAGTQSSEKVRKAGGGKDRSNG
jgi:hypothetical protein